MLAERVIVTDGVFSMDGYFAPLPGICDLADRYGALVMVDDSHAVGFMGERGRGTPELFDVIGRVDIITGTLGKAWAARRAVTWPPIRDRRPAAPTRSSPTCSPMPWPGHRGAGSLAALALAARPATDARPG